jgi:allantoin racemase
MCILLANPNTTVAVTERMGVTARAVAAAGTEIKLATAAFGARIITTRTDAAIAEHACVDLVGREAAGCDGVIIGASLDSGLRAVREGFAGPVVGLTEAALHVACLVGRRVGLVVTSAHAAGIAEELVAGYGLSSRLAGIAPLGTEAAAILAQPAVAVDAIVDAGRLLVARDRVDVVVLIGAVMAGLPEAVQPRIPVPVVEGVSAAVVLVESLVRLRRTNG